MVRRSILVIAAVAMLGACATDVEQALLSDETLAPLVLTNPQAVDGRILTGGQPSQDDLTYLKSRGFGTVISLRRDDEDVGYDQAAVVADLGLTYVNIPVSTQKGLDATTAAYLRSVINQTTAPVLVHCGSGNRVGALYALGAFHLDGKTLEQSLAIGRSAGLTRFEPTVREILEGAATK